MGYLYRWVPRFLTLAPRLVNYIKYAEHYTALRHMRAERFMHAETHVLRGLPRAILSAKTKNRIRKSPDLGHVTRA